MRDAVCAPVGLSSFLHNLLNHPPLPRECDTAKAVAPETKKYVNMEEITAAHHTRDHSEPPRTETTAAAAGAPPQAPADGLPRSVFVADNAPVHMVPTSVISRPLIPELDEGKVLDFMQKLEAGVELTPIEVAWVEAEPGENYYFAFGGCHRWEAARRLGLGTIPAKLIRVAPVVINTYLGASSPFRKRG